MCIKQLSAQTAQDSANAELYFKTLNYDSLFYSMSLWSSTRDLEYRNNTSSSNNRVSKCTTSGYNSCKAIGACQTAKIFSFCNTSDSPITVCDAFGNVISKLGVYGSDSRTNIMFTCRQM